MQRKDYVVVCINVVVAGGLVAGLLMGKVTWDQLLIGLGLLGLPSVASLKGGADAGK